MALTVGTAGHIDHGKTALVRALTGRDTDRLPEERRRGISIDLGYAPLVLPDGSQLSLVDVPGHERFVRTMVAGATGIDLFLLVIDAREGVRAQTLEHLAILRLLAIDRGVVAVTKSDLVPPDDLAHRLEEARLLVPGARAVAVSAVTGAGLDDLRCALADTVAAVVPRLHERPTRLPIDRVFSLPGIGTVVTGTLWSGVVRPGDELLLQPTGRTVRVRSVQVHDEPVDRASAGQRVAVGLAGLPRDATARGDVLVAPGAFPRSYRLEVSLEELEPIAHGARLSVHHGTARIPGRVVRVGEAHAQLRLAAPVVAARGDRVVLRSDRTVGGGLVLDPDPPRRADEGRDLLLERGDPASVVRALVDGPVRRDRLAARALLDGDELEEGLDAVAAAGEWVFAPTWLERVSADIEDRLRLHAEASPLDPGLALGSLLPMEEWAAVILDLLPIERRGGRAYLPGSTPSLGAHAADAQALLAELERSGCASVETDDPALARFLEGRGDLVRLGDGRVMSSGGVEVARDVLLGELRAAGEVTLARFRDLLGVGRRDAQLLLERFDGDGLTRRDGDRRVPRRGALGDGL